MRCPGQHIELARPWRDQCNGPAELSSKTLEAEVPFPIDDLHLLISLHHPPPRLLHLPPHPESLWFIGLLLPHPGAFLEPSVGGFSGDLRKIKVSCGTTFRCRRRGHRW
jgi:hypothetical protein